MADLRMANLTQEDLEEIRLLENRLGGVCLVAVEPINALYVVEAKTAPNCWQGVDLVYGEISQLKSYFREKEDALLAKTTLKNLLKSGRLPNARKFPLRVRKI